MQFVKIKIIIALKERFKNLFQKDTRMRTRKVLLLFVWHGYKGELWKEMDTSWGHFFKLLSLFFEILGSYQNIYVSWEKPHLLRGKCIKVLSCSADFWDALWYSDVVCGDAGLHAGLTTPDAGVGRESTPDESRLFAGVGALSTWAVMRMTDSCEFRFYARRAPRRTGEIAEKCSAATGRRRLRTMRIYGSTWHEYVGKSLA